MNDTSDFDREPSAYPIPTIHPSDPLGNSAQGDMAFGTGPVVVEPNGKVTTRFKAPGIVGGGTEIAAGP